jgi:hypothetical protein
MSDVNRIVILDETDRVDFAAVDMSNVDVTIALENLGAQAKVTGTPGQFVVIGGDGNLTTLTILDAEGEGF